MINSNEKHALRGKVIKLDRYKDGSIATLAVLLESGLVVESVYNLQHKTIQFGEYVSCTIRFRITSDRYVLEGVRRSKAV